MTSCLLCWTRVDVAPILICPPLLPMTAWISLAAVSPTSNLMTVSWDSCPTMWEEMNLISRLASSVREFMTPIPRMGDSMRARGSLATPWYLTDQLETRGSWLLHLARRETCPLLVVGIWSPSTMLMSASPESRADARPAAVCGPSVGVTPRCPRVRFQASKAMTLLPDPWSVSTMSMAASMATLRSCPSKKLPPLSVMMTLSTSGSVISLPSSSYRVTSLGATLATGRAVLGVARCCGGGGGGRTLGMAPVAAVGRGWGCPEADEVEGVGCPPWPLPP